jgi:hypothetical protein
MGKLLLLPWAHKSGEKPNRGIMQPHFSLLGCWKFKPRVNLAGTSLNPPPFLAATTAQPRVLRAILFMAKLSRALLPLLSRERPLPSSCDSRTTSRKASCFLGLSWRADLRWNQQEFSALMSTRNCASVEDSVVSSPRARRKWLCRYTGI